MLSSGHNSIMCMNDTATTTATSWKLLLLVQDLLVGEVGICLVVRTTTLFVSASTDDGDALLRVVEGVAKSSRHYCISRKFNSHCNCRRNRTEEG